MRPFGAPLAKNNIHSPAYIRGPLYGALQAMRRSVWYVIPRQLVWSVRRSTELPGLASTAEVIQSQLLGGQ